MLLMEWTERQQEVIDKKGSELLVSAAAGSGKTAVLVEKIKRTIIEDGVGIDRFLVVTFTRAAAAEMKEKIAEAITKAAENDPDNAGFLQSQLSKMPSADISTFDSFAIDIVRNYFYVIDIDPNLQIASEEDTAIMKHDAMEETFERIYESEDEALFAFLDAYSSHKSDAAIKEKIIKLYDSFMSMPEGISWLNYAINDIPKNEKELASSDLMRRVDKFAFDDITSALKYYRAAGNALFECGVDKLAKKNELDVQKLIRMMQETGAGLYESVISFTPERMTATNDEKESYAPVKERVAALRKKAKEKIDSVKKNYFAEPIPEMARCMNETVPHVKSLYTILQMFEHAYAEKKSQGGQMDFADSNHYAIKILEDERVAAEIRDKYDYIFIDEYQDSNYLQEAIISSIRKDDNLFMVGDIKQSIYGFRMAEPDIFKERYQTLGMDDTPGGKIDLSSNFRSKRSVIDTVNDIFKDIMEDYDENARLYKGDPYDGDIDYKSSLHIINAATDEDEEVNSIDDSILNMKSTEREAVLASRIVRDSLGKLIYDSKAAIERPLEKKDIVILLRSAKGRSEKFYEALTADGIEAYIDDNSGYFDTVEIQTFMDLVRFIDNSRQDIPMLTVLRSPIFGFTVDELVRIRLRQPRDEFYSAFFAYPDDPDADPLIASRIQDVITFLDHWQHKQTYTPVDSLLRELMQETDYYLYAGLMPAGQGRQANLRSLLVKAGDFARKGRGTLHDFIKYIENTKNVTDTAQAASSTGGEDAVRIMTIHKSKGLEFPMVIVCGMNRQIMPPKHEKDGIWHKDIGFALQYVDLKKRYRQKTLMGNVIVEQKKKDELDEEKRILYVALTRARDKLVMIAHDKDWQKTQDGFVEGVVDGSSYLKMIAPVIDTDITDIIEHDIQELSEMKHITRYMDDRRSLIDRFEKEADDISDLRKEIRKEIDEALSFKYPYTDDLERRSKYSVTELNRHGTKEYDFVIPSFAMSDNRISGAALGTIMHTVMECIDFADFYDDPSNDKLQILIDDLVTSNTLAPEEADAVETDKIISFFKSDIGRRAANAGKKGDGSLKKEQHFNIMHEADGDMVMVQGIIDCCFTETDEAGNEYYVLVDYKTNYETKGIEELYRDQIMLYKEALEKSTGIPVRESYLYLFSTGELRIIE